MAARVPAALVAAVLLAGSVRAQSPSPLVGKPAPAISAATWLGSQPLSLPTLKGKVVLVDFWATWCAPCVAGFRTLRDWHDRYAQHGLVIIGLTNLDNQTLAQIKSLVDRQKLPWAVAVDEKGDTQNAYGVLALPHTFLIDRAGIVRAAHLGSRDMAAIEQEIRKLLGVAGR